MREQSLLSETWNNPRSIKHSVMLSWNPMAVWSTSLLLFFFFTDRRNLFDLNTCHSVYKSYLQVNTLVSHLNTFYCSFCFIKYRSQSIIPLGEIKILFRFINHSIFLLIVREAGYMDQSRSMLNSPNLFPPRDSEGTYRDGSGSLISEAGTP